MHMACFKCNVSNVRQDSNDTLLWCLMCRYIWGDELITIYSNSVQNLCRLVDLRNKFPTCQTVPNRFDLHQPGMITSLFRSPVPIGSPAQTSFSWTPYIWSIWNLLSAKSTFLAFLLIPFITTVAIFVLHSCSAEVYLAEERRRKVEESFKERVVSAKED